MARWWRIGIFFVVPFLGLASLPLNAEEDAEPSVEASEPEAGEFVDPAFVKPYEEPTKPTESSTKSMEILTSAQTKLILALKSIYTLSKDKAQSLCVCADKLCGPYLMVLTAPQREECAFFIMDTAYSILEKSSAVPLMLVASTPDGQVAYTDIMDQYGEIQFLETFVGTATTEQLVSVMYHEFGQKARQLKDIDPTETFSQAGTLLNACGEAVARYSQKLP